MARVRARKRRSGIKKTGVQYQITTTTIIIIKVGERRNKEQESVRIRKSINRQKTLC
jgi:hypothetical protein